MPRQRRRHGHRPDGFHNTVLCHRFPGRDRQETLDEIYLDNLLTCQVNGSWSADVGLNPAEEGRNMVYAWISAEDGRDTLPFGEEDIEKAEFIVENSGSV